MSRGREDVHEIPGGRVASGSDVTHAPRGPDRETTPDRLREPPHPTAEALVDRLDLPRGAAREAVYFGGTPVRLNGDDVRVLATVGTFRTVPVPDLGDEMDRDRGTLRHLRESGLLTVAIVSREAKTPGRDAAVAVLTPAGRDLLEAHRQDQGEGRQQYHAGLVKPQELAHDASLYRVYRAAARDLADEGRWVTRVVLDAELKASYQRFLNRADRPEDTTLDADRAAFGATHRLAVVDGQLQLPDLRLEYEGPDGERGTRDVELVTEHYSRAHLAGKRQAGFTLYRARPQGGRAFRGGRPYDPHQITRLLA